MAGRVEGAALQVRYVEPALDLATLAACLADAVDAPPVAQERTRPDALERSRPLLEWRPADGVMAVHTGAVLARLSTTRYYRALLSLPSAGGGFIRDAPVPRASARAYLGGRITEGSGGRLQEAIALLAGRVEREIDRVVRAGFDPAALVQPEDAALRAIGQRVRQDPAACLEMETRVRQTAIGPVATSQRERASEIGRLMAAVEEVEGDRADHFERLAAAVRELLHEDGVGDRAIAAALAHHRDQAQRPGSQLSRFFDFLEDAALARVRLEVTFLIMEAVAGAAATRTPRADMALLVAYVRRATGLFRTLTAPDGEELFLNLSREFGVEADFALHDELSTAGFAGCLPVWADWVTQLFEQQQRGPGPHATATREVSYRFRVNGPTRDERRPAFEARLARIRRALHVPAAARRGVRRRLAELVFLWAVIPADPTAPDPSPEGALATAREQVRALEQGGAAAITQALDDLERRAATVRKISQCLIAVLKTVGTAVTARAMGRWWDCYVNVRRTLVDRQRIGFAVDTPLMLPADSPAREAMAFFRQIHVTSGRPLPGHLFSLRVRGPLADRALRAGEAVTQASLVREPRPAWLQVVWRPEPPSGVVDGPERHAVARWCASPRIELFYHQRWLGTAQPLEEQLTLLAARRCAFSILAFVVLQALLHRAQHHAQYRAQQRAQHVHSADLPGAPASPGSAPGSDAATLENAALVQPPRLAVSLFRVQRSGRAAEPYGGEQGLFAAAQAVTLALGRDFDVRMQGLALDEAAGSEETVDKRRGLYAALVAGAPVLIRRTGRIGESAPEPRLALIVHGARPCNGHPEPREVPESTLFVVRTYLAQAGQAAAGAGAGCRLERQSVRCEVRHDEGNAALPDVLVEQIRHLYEQEGCRHIMVLSHRYGGRHIGWGAARMRSPAFPRLLAELAAGFPGLCLYPLARDTFPVTRLRERFPDEDAFEILRPDEHLDAAPAEVHALRHAYTPVYSLATLHVVGRATKPQSGFCTYFLLASDAGGSIEATAQLRANFLLSGSAVRADLIAVLRGVHFLESERAASDDGTLQPVLDPHSWLQPETIGHTGEVQVSASRRRAGTVVLSLPAVLERVSRVLHAQPDHSRRPQ